MFRYRPHSLSVTTSRLPLHQQPKYFCTQLEVCKEQVQWAQTEKRTFLRQRIEVRLATLYLETRDYTAAISLIGKLLTEVSCISMLEVSYASTS